MCSLATYAANVSLIDLSEIRSTKLQKISKSLNELGEFMQDNVVLYNYAFVIHAKKASESMPNTIKQMIYSQGGAYGPTSAYASRLAVKKLDQHLESERKLIQDTYRDWDMDDEYMTSVMSAFEKYVTALTDNKKNLKFYKTGHDGVFYFAGGIAIYNDYTNEVLFVEIAHEE